MLIRQELQKILEFHTSMPGAKPIINEEGRVRLKDPSTSTVYVGLLWTEILERAPAYFACKHREARGHGYGSVVHQEFVKMWKNRVATGISHKLFWNNNVISFCLCVAFLLKTVANLQIQAMCHLSRCC